MSSACQTDNACAKFRLPGWESSFADDDEIPGDNMTCYKGGDAVVQNYQMCDVTSEFLSLTSYHCFSCLTNAPASDPAIIRELGKRKPQVTFSCAAGPGSTNFGQLQTSEAADDEVEKTCNFQFWIEQVESFYCQLSECDWETSTTYDAIITEYSCKTIQCDCIPGRMLCGEDGSVSESCQLVHLVL